LGFARHIDVRFQTIYLEKIIREVLEFLGKESEYRSISVTLEVADNFPSIESDLGQLEQIFLNIINNAFAAVDDGGKIDIKLSTDEPETASVRITDDGCGISEENQKHIFDPFFSTKGEGGTGLGLSITYGLAQKLGGKLDVESKEGEGSSFTVTLPIKRGQLPISNEEDRIEGITGR
jgi:signal transduction histidine kinase